MDSFLHDRIGAILSLLKQSNRTCEDDNLPKPVDEVRHVFQGCGTTWLVLTESEHMLKWNCVNRKGLAGKFTNAWRLRAYIHKMYVYQLEGNACG
jgi:hypothetical protein